MDIKPVSFTKYKINHNSNPSFTHSWKEHKSWGATFDSKTNGVNFKLFTFPDAKQAFVTIKKEDSKYTTELKNMENGVFQTEKPVPKEYAQAGDSYFYTIKKADDSLVRVKDPYSLRQKELLNSSIIYNHSDYKWNDSLWFNGNPERISRLYKEKNLTSPQNARIYELNIASFTQEGTLEAAKEKLSKIKELGFNAIEIMPLEATYSFNWGYDGVDKFAVSEHLGGPDKLKELVDYAHMQNLNVIIDMVPNHLGPDGAQLHITGPYIKGDNAFGSAFNFEGENSKYVRDYIINAALNWIENYHCDGLRLDMTKYMESDVTMKQLAAEINYHTPDAFLIAEDSREGIAVHGNEYWQDYYRLHDARVTMPLEPEEYGRSMDEKTHSEAIKKIEKGQSSLARLGFDSEWDFKYFHALKELLYFPGSSIGEFTKILNDAQTRVKYVMSHDEIGNFDGTRLIAKLMANSLNLEQFILLEDKDIKRIQDYMQLKNTDYYTASQTVKSQKAQIAGEKLAIMLQTDAFDKESKNDEASKKIIASELKLNPNSNITFSKAQKAFFNAFCSNKMAAAITFSLPGPKMIFQGDESADLTPFRFFREFDYNKSEPYLYIEKGYQSGRPALEASTFGYINYTRKAKNSMENYKNLIRDLNSISASNSAISNGQIEKGSEVIHYRSNVIGYRTKSENEEIYTVVNFSDTSYPKGDIDKYYIEFPKGKWVEILNTDDKKYGGKGHTNSKTIITSDGQSKSPIVLPLKSTLIFKKVN